MSRTVETPEYDGRTLQETITAMEGTLQGLLSGEFAHPPWEDLDEVIERTRTDLGRLRGLLPSLSLPELTIEFLTTLIGNCQQCGTRFCPNCQAAQTLVDAWELVEGTKAVEPETEPETAPTPEGARRVIARCSTTCCTCDEAIDLGTKVFWVRADAMLRWSAGLHHIHCLVPEPDGNGSKT